MVTDCFLQQAQQGTLDQAVSGSGACQMVGMGFQVEFYNLPRGWWGLGHLEPSGQSLFATSSLGGLPVCCTNIITFHVCPGVNKS